MRFLATFGILLIVIVTTAFGVQIKCEFSDEGWGAGLGVIYSCYTTETTRENPRVITSITGDHLLGRTNINVKGFWIVGNDFLTTVPDGLNIFFPNLEVFMWYNGALLSIDGVIFKAFPNLKAIGFQGNRLISIPGDLFKYTPNVQEIYLAGISLEHAGIGLLTGLNAAKLVAFDGNLCINMFADTPALIQELKFKLINQCPPLPAIAECFCKEEIGDLKEEIYGIEEGMGELQNKNVRFQEMIVEVQEDVGKMKEGVGELKEGVGVLMDKNVELQNEIGVITEGKVELQNKIVRLQEMIGEVQEDVREVQNKNVKLEEMIGEVQEDVSEVKEGVDVLKDKHVELKNEVSGLKESIGEIKEKIIEMDGKLDLLLGGSS